jgi:hypothetical protein
MPAGRLADVLQVQIRIETLVGTVAALREWGEKGYERLVLWIGHVYENVAVVEDALIPTQRPITSEDGVGYFIPRGALFEVNKYLSEHQLRLIAQVHSHPTEAFHSSTDDAFAIVTAEGGFSLVVPDFGDAPADPRAWAVYRLTEGRWREMFNWEVEQTFIIYD